MLLHTATASPLPAAPTAVANAGVGLPAGTTTVGTGPNAGATTAGGTSASRQRAAASQSQTQQPAVGLAGRATSNTFVSSRHRAALTSTQCMAVDFSAETGT